METLALMILTWWLTLGTAGWMVGMYNFPGPLTLRDFFAFIVALVTGPVFSISRLSTSEGKVYQLQY